MRHAQIFEMNLVAALSTCFDLKFDITIEGLDFGEITKHRIVQRNLKCAVQIVAIARIYFVRANRNVDINVTLQATAEADLTLTRELQTQAVFDPGRNVKVKSPACSHAAFTSTTVALVGNHLTKTTAGTARLRDHHIAQK